MLFTFGVCFGPLLDKQAGGPQDSAHRKMSNRMLFWVVRPIVCRPYASGFDVLRSAGHQKYISAENNKKIGSKQPGR